MANGENLHTSNQDWWSLSNDQRFMQTGESNVDRFAREKATRESIDPEKIAFYQNSQEADFYKNNPNELSKLIGDDPEKVKWYQEHPDKIGQLLADYHDNESKTLGDEARARAKQAAKDAVKDEARKQVIEEAKAQAVETAGEATRDTYEARGEKVNEVVINQTAEAAGASTENSENSENSDIPEVEPISKVDDFVDADISGMDDTEKANFYAKLTDFTPEERAEAREKLNQKLAILKAKKAELLSSSSAGSVAEPESESKPAPEPTPAPESEPEPDVETTIDNLEKNPDVITEEEARATIEKAKNKPTLKERLKKIIPRALVVALAAVAAVTAFSGKVGDPGRDTYKSYDEYRDDQNDDTKGDTEESVIEVKSEKRFASPETGSSAYAGELPNGTTYDFTEYADRENKVSKNAFGYDKSYIHGDREKTEKAFAEMSAKGPEYLASYAYDILTDSEKQELGIDGWTATELDDYMSNNENGGNLQKSIQQKLSDILTDKDNTRYDWYTENDTESTYYIYFVDENGDNIMTPEEMHLSQDTKKRNGAPQVDIYRLIDGDWVKVGDYNEACGLQGNYETPVPGVPEIPEKDNPVTPPEDSDDDTTIEENDDDTTIEQGDDDDTTIEEDDDDDTTPEEDDDDDDTIEEEDDDDDEKIKPKDSDNLERIDDQINKDIAEDVGTDEIRVTPTADVNDEEELTDKPTGEDYEGTEADIVQNEASESAEPVQETVSEENDYSENQGGANADEYSPNVDNDAAQAEADASETPVEEAPSTVEEAEDTLEDLGIN